MIIWSSISIGIYNWSTVGVARIRALTDFISIIYSISVIVFVGVVGITQGDDVHVVAS